MAPMSTKFISLSARPSTIGAPNPPAPMSAANVAVPIVMIVEVFSTDQILILASGSSKRTSFCHGDKQTVSDTSDSKGSIPLNPKTVPATTGSRAYKHSATTAGIGPIPRNGINKQNNASDGTV